MVTSLDYAGVYEQVREGALHRAPLETVFCGLSLSRNLNANLAFMEPQEGGSMPPACRSSPPGWLGTRARPSWPGRGQLCPPHWARPQDTAPGLGLARGTSPSPSWSQPQEAFSCPHPKGNNGLGASCPAQGEQGEVDVAGERHVDCNLSAGRTFLSKSPWGAAL